MPSLSLKNYAKSIHLSCGQYGDGGYRVDTSIVNEVHMYGHGGLACGHDSLEQVCGHGLAYLAR